MRIARDLARYGSAQLQGYARVSAALQAPAQAEGALGFALFPDHDFPAYIAAERRIELSPGGRNATAVYVAGSLPPQRVAERVRVEGYAQAGVVGFRQRDGFVDGRVSLMRSDAKERFGIGASISGAAQPGLSRLDIGPALSVPLQLEGAGFRATLEWRHRVAGNAAPRSGIAMTLGADF